MSPYARKLFNHSVPLSHGLSTIIMQHYQEYTMIIMTLEYNMWTMYLDNNYGNYWIFDGSNFCGFIGYYLWKFDPHIAYPQNYIHAVSCITTPIVIANIKCNLANYHNVYDTSYAFQPFSYACIYCVHVRGSKMLMTSGIYNISMYYKYYYYNLA